MTDQLDEETISRIENNPHSYRHKTEIKEYIKDIIEELREKNGKFPASEEIKEVFKNRTGSGFINSFLNNTSVHEIKHEMGELKEKRENRRKLKSPDGAIIYILECIRESDGEIFYYVGAVIDTPLELRLQQHKSKRGDFACPDVHKMEMFMNKGVTDLEIELIDTYTVSDFLLSKDEFRDVVLWEERKTANKICIEKETVNVIGGR